MVNIDYCKLSKLFSQDILTMANGNSKINVCLHYFLEQNKNTSENKLIGIDYFSLQPYKQGEM